MDLINTGAQVIVIPGYPIKFKHGTSYNLRKATKHKIEEKIRMSHLNIALPKFPTVIVSTSLKYPIVGKDTRTH